MLSQERCGAADAFDVMGGGILVQGETGIVDIPTPLVDFRSY